MKKLISAIFILISVNLFASGTLSFENQYFLGQKKFGPLAGLSVDEELLLGLSYHGWHGGGLNYETKWWLTSKNDLDVELTNDLSLSFGGTYRINPYNESDVHVGLTYNLW